MGGIMGSLSGPRWGRIPRNGQFGQKPPLKPRGRPATVIGEASSWRGRSLKAGTNGPGAKNERTVLIEDDPILEQEPDERPRNIPVRRFLSISVLVILVVAVIFVLIGLQIRHGRLGREVSQLTVKKRTLLEENRQLRSELSRLTSLDDLEYVANTLGLVRPDSNQIVVIP
jgi:cell division protein FtsL